MTDLSQCGGFGEGGADAQAVASVEGREMDGSEKRGDDPRNDEPTGHKHQQHRFERGIR